MQSISVQIGNMVHLGIAVVIYFAFENSLIFISTAGTTLCLRALISLHVLQAHHLSLSHTTYCLFPSHSFIIFMHSSSGWLHYLHRWLGWVCHISKVTNVVLTIHFFTLYCPFDFFAIIIKKKNSVIWMLISAKTTRIIKIT